MHRVRTIINPQYIIQETREERRRLQEKFNEVDDRCQQAKSDGKEIKENVNIWLNTTQDTLTEVEKWLQKLEIERNTSTCFTCSTICTSKWVLAHKQRKDAIQNKEKLCGKINEGLKLPNNVSYLRPATGITLLPSNGFNRFDSVKNNFDKIMGSLKKNQSIIGIHGMGGVGKTALVKEACEEAEIMEKLFSKVVVTVVSQAPNVLKIQAEFAEQLCLRYTSDDSEICRAKELKARMKYEDTILVVLDDVWSEIDLATIGIPFGKVHPGCKVIITTRYESLCSKMRCTETIHLVPLTPSDSWDLFKIHVGNTLSGYCEYEDEVKQVVEECGGLPLAIIVVASALKDKSKEEWKLALEKLKYSLAIEIEEISDKVYASIKLSYDFLTAETTKKCFLMCSLFPKDSDISVEAFTGYPLGYGLLDEDTESYESANMQVIVMMRNLLTCNLLMKTDKAIRMHNVVRQAALWITSKGEEIFLVPIPSHDNWTNDKRLSNATTISLLSCPMNKHLPSLTEYPRLKMLLMAQRIPLPNVLIDTCFKRLTSLHVLDMSQVSSQLLELELPSSFESLCNLRALYLRRWILKGNMSVIGSFKYLRILSFAGSQIDNLPVELKELSELVFVDLSACVAKGMFDQEVLFHLSKIVDEFRTPNNPILDLIYDKE